MTLGPRLQKVLIYLKDGPPDLAEKELSSLFADHSDVIAQEIERALAINDESAELHFLAALNAYRRGHILECRQQMEDAAELGFSWDEETPLDAVITSLFTPEEYRDLENLYLDAAEPTPRNRWLSITYAVDEWLDSRKSPNGATPGRIFAETFDAAFLQNGKAELWRIIDDLAKNPANQEAAAELKKHLRAEDYPSVAEMMLGMTLNHLCQFSHFFGLTEEEIRGSELQSLLLLLPLRLAVALFLLYAVSRPLDVLHESRPLPKDTAAMIAAALITFYHEADRYRPSAAQNFYTEHNP
ncbi:MAG: hypothetical protein ONB24_11665 [candidate division KSB1 bacterium]|nr:hypothetical protein [candidate division KSB1 bacterium]